MPRDTRTPHVVIIGGGFGGLEAAKALDEYPVRVTLVDARNHHLFQPLLYQVAMAGLSPADIAIPIRAVLNRYPKVRTLMATVTSVDLGARAVHLADGDVLRYDYLVLGAGARTNYFGNDHWGAHALGLKSVEDALEIRRQVLLAYERAERSDSDKEKRKTLTFVIIGAGPTGVELAGSLAELSDHVLSEDYKNLTAETSHVVLLEGAPKVLNGFGDDLSARARADLEELGVEVRTECFVKDIDAEGVVLEDERIDAGVVIWSAGVEAAPLTRTLGVDLDRSGRVRVEDDCSIPGHREAFAVGDNACFIGEDGNPLPGVSPVAMQQARHVAKLIGRRLAGQDTLPFEYFDKGMMATIGRSRAVARSKGLAMTGFLAWLAWLFVHLWYLVGFKNRVFVFLSWIWNYVMYRRGARLITHERIEGSSTRAQS